jgi:hypothetical protein
MKQTASPSHWRASALLMTLLIIAMVSGGLLIGTRAVIVTTRSAAQITNATMALQMARSGIEEGYRRYSQDTWGAVGVKGNILLNGEYGVGAKANMNMTDPNRDYSLKPMRRGFLTGCTQLSSDFDPSDSGATYSSDCPYYDLSIRNTVAFGTGTSVSYSYSYRDMAGVGQIVTYPVVRATQIIRLSVQNNSGGTIEWCVARAGVCYGPQVVTMETLSPGSTSSSFVLINPTDTDVSIKAKPSSDFVTSKGALTVTANSLAPTQDHPRPFAISKGYTTIYSTGYSGGIKKTLALTIRANDPDFGGPSTLLYESTDEIGENGLPRF